MFSAVQPGGGLDGADGVGVAGGEDARPADCYLGAHPHRARLHQDPQSHSRCKLTAGVNIQNNPEVLSTFTITHEN